MKRLFAVVLGLAILPALAFAQLIDLQPAATVKLVRTEPILVKQLKAEVAKLEAQAQRVLTADERRQVLDVMINERLALQAAERDKVVVTDAELAAQLEQSRSQMAAQLGRAPTDAEFEAAVKSETGLDLAAYKAKLKTQYIIQKYLLFKYKDVIQGIQNPTQAEIQAAYDLAKAKLVRPDTIRFAMIFIPFPAGADGRAKAQATADRLLKEINGLPGKFDELAMRGQAAGLDYQAGDGGYLPRSTEAQQVVGADFMAAAFSLKVGEVSKLLENVRGFQIIKVTETYIQKTLELSDPYQLGQRGTVAEYLASLLLQSRQQETIDRVTKQLVEELRKGDSFQVFDKALVW
jgi:parvulin-like peptidyl-prolyl isomerase